MKTQTTGYQFDGFTLDLERRELRHDASPLALNPRYFDALALLVRNAGALIPKQQLFESVWRDVHVSDAALTQCIKDIRKVLGDDAANPRYIKTQPRRGYAFIGDLQPLIATSDGAQRPYKSLSSFTEDDAARFYGREEEITRITSMIQAHATFLLYGRSGAGKSSLLAAGLIPALRDQGFDPQLVPLGPDAPADLEHEIRTHYPLGEADLLEGLQDLRRDRIAPSQRIFAFDRVENLFRLGDAKRREAFLDGLAALRRADNGVRFVFVVREDYLAAISAFKRVFPNIFHTEFRLGRLGREAAVRAMLEPAKAVGCRFEEGLPEHLIDELGDEHGVDPPFLQIACDRLFDARDAENRFTFAAYRELGGAAGMIAAYLDRVLLRLPPENGPPARALLLALVSPEGARMTRPLGPVCEQVGREAAVGRDRARDILEELADARIVRIRTEPGEIWVELIHDYLVAPVSRWLDEETLALAKLRELLARAERNYAEQGLLIAHDELELLLKAGPALKPGPTTAVLLTRSCLARAVAPPAWLAQTTPEFVDMIDRALHDSDPSVRETAVAGLPHRTDAAARTALAETALTDPSHKVRKASAIGLARLDDTDITHHLKAARPKGLHGLLRQLTALAVLRDEDRSSIRLRGQGPLVILAVTAGLALVRLQRERSRAFHQISRGGFGAALAATIYAVALSWLMGDPDAMLAFASVGGFTGLALGLGVSTAVVAVEVIGYRHERWWRIPGGALGGAIAAALLHQISQAMGYTFLDTPFRDVGGWREGLFLAGGACVGAFIVPWRRRSMAITAAAITAGLAAVLATSFGGHLLPASLHHMGEQLQRPWRPLAMGEFSRALVSFAEGALWATGLLAGLVWRRSDKDPDLA